MDISDLDKVSEYIKELQNIKSFINVCNSLSRIISHKLEVKDCTIDGTSYFSLKLSERTFEFVKKSLNERINELEEILKSL